MPEAVEQLLRSLKTSDRVRASAWDAVYEAPDDASAQKLLQQLPLGDDVKAQLWDARAALAPSVAPARQISPGAAERGNAPVVPPQPSAGRGTQFSQDLAIDRTKDIGQGVGSAIPFAGIEMPDSGAGVAGRVAGEAALWALPVSKLVKPAGKVVEAAAKVIPTRAKAGAKFQQVMGAVGDKPVDLAQAGNSALRIQELAERGGAMPKAVRDLLRRATDPSKADMTYKETRDFYSNISRLSADEMKRLAPPVKRELGALREALNEALAKTAASGGQERVYRAAMREYRIASRTRELAEQLAKWGAGVAGVGAAYKVGQAVLD